jgi:hypothetical protein
MADPETVIASEAKQSIGQRKERMDCFAALAMTRDPGAGQKIADLPAGHIFH